MTGKPHKSIWKGIHKWVGAVMALLLSVFCLSGIILNHRGAVSGMFIFFSGLLSIMVLVSGLILHNRFKNKKHNNK